MSTIPLVVCQFALYISSRYLEKDVFYRLQAKSSVICKHDYIGQHLQLHHWSLPKSKTVQRLIPVALPILQMWWCMVFMWKWLKCSLDVYQPSGVLPEPPAWKKNHKTNTYKAPLPCDPVQGVLNLYNKRLKWSPQIGHLIQPESTILQLVKSHQIHLLYLLVHTVYEWK